ncbi:hypothetical protein QYE76_021076 [Lolium multiflorum]|uniref:Uncharacterized protein n=1 Tax=Lolium multiflorum TaxID=4521 RepID=A0AAD8VQK8_LOLMU|nr:hypothetical protein QYE76_021076 [Lolium multiflorum]
MDASATRAELETLRKELEDLEERVRVTKQLIQDKEALVARSQDEAKGLRAGLKTDLAEIRTLSNQLVTGKDEDDKAEIAEADRVRVDAILALVRQISALYYVNAPYSYLGSVGIRVADVAAGR